MKQNSGKIFYIGQNIILFYDPDIALYNEFMIQIYHYIMIQT